ALSAALREMPGILGLGFDLIHGTMTVEYEPTTTDPAAMMRRGADPAGLGASMVRPPPVPGGGAPLWGGGRPGGFAAGLGPGAVRGGGRSAPGRAAVVGPDPVRPGGPGRRVRPLPPGPGRAEAGPVRYVRPHGSRGARCAGAGAVGRGGDGGVPLRAVGS